jgi:glycosyltransferase involved in cell wall biosynthesis
MVDRFYLDLLLTMKIVLSNSLKPVFILAYNQEAALISKLTNFFKSPVVVDIQGAFREELASHGQLQKLGKIGCLFERKLFEFPSLILVSNPFLANFMIREMGVDPKKVEVILDSVDTDLFIPRSKDDPKVECLRSIFGIKKRARVVLYVGSFSALQGTDILLQALKLVLEQEKDLLFVLAGGRWSKDYESYVRTAENLGISSHVKFIPGVSYVRTLPYLLNLADVAVAPKRFSLQSHGKLAVLMASGLPTVLFDNPVNKLFLGSLGIYAREICAEAFAEAIISGMSKADNDGLRVKLRERAVRCFSLARLVNDMQRVYQRVAG